MKRTYKIGDIITIRGRRYQVRTQSEYSGLDFCDHCAFSCGEFCNLRRYYRHFLIDCSGLKAYFKRL